MKEKFRYQNSDGYCIHKDHQERGRGHMKCFPQGCPHLEQCKGEKVLLDDEENKEYLKNFKEKRRKEVKLVHQRAREKNKKSSPIGTLK